MSRVARAAAVLAALACCQVSVGTPAQASRPAIEGATDRLSAMAAPGSASKAVPPSARGPAVTRQAPQPPKRRDLSIETLSPSRLLPGTPVQVSGTVFNDTDDTWGDAQVGMLVSGTPFTSTGEVAAATTADPYEEFAGEQVLDAGTFDDIGDVAPGQSRSFAFTVPYGELDLTGADGVYWVGAELRVTNGDGLRGSVARSLTFMPMVSDAADAPAVDMAVLWPMMAGVPWDGDQFVDDSLTRQFATDGRLSALAGLGASADTRPLTWVLDPAVLDAARVMSEGFEQNGRELDEDSTEATAAAEWLRVTRRSTGNTVSLAVPYGNPDVAALAHNRLGTLVRKTRRAGERVLDNLGIPRFSLLWPADGRSDRRVLARAGAADTEMALLSRNTFAELPAGPAVGLRSTSALSDRTRDTPTLVVDHDGNRMGLRAQPGQTTLQWRQLLLANTALRSLNGGGSRRGVVAMPAPGWWPDEAWRDADLFEGLEVPWLDLVSANALASQDHPTYRGALRYPQALRRNELGPTLIGQLRDLRRSTHLVNGMLTDPVGNRVRTDKAFGISSSSAWREDRLAGRELAAHFVETNRAAVEGVDLEAPNFVTLSSTSGRFPISLTNRLDEPVTVQLAVTARDPNMTVEPIEPVTLQRDQRVTVTVLTNSKGVGITTLRARMLTNEGRAFGPVSTFQVRTTQIGALVWVVMGVGGTVLFGAAGRRIFLRVRGRRRRVRGAR